MNFSLDGLLSSDASARQQAHMDGGGATARGMPISSIDVGQPDPLSLPMEELIAAAQQVLATDRTTLLYGAREGYGPLREIVAQKTRQLEALEVDPEQIIITNGSSQGIAMVAHVLLDRGDWILIDEASWGVRVFKGFGANAVPVRWDDDGPIIADIEAAISVVEGRGKRVKLFYTIPNFQNPLGITASLERRRAVLELATQHSFPILEDDAYVELRFEGDHLPSYYELDESRSRVIRAGTFSKIFGAGIRLGWAMASREFLTLLLSFKLDGGASPFASRILVEYLRNHMFKHIEDLVGVYREKRDIMVRSLYEGLGSDAMWSHPQGGFFIWLTLPVGVNPDRVMRECGRRGVAVWSGGQFRWDGEDNRHIRLSYSFATPNEIKDGVGVLCEEVLRLMPR